MNSDNLYTKYILRLSIATASILCIPFIAMQFTGEVNWTLADYIFAGTMIFGSGLLYKYITGKSEISMYRIAIGFSILSGFLLLWVNLAVGKVGSENNPANLLYFGVIIFGLISAFISRFKSSKMALIMFSMAILQGLVTLTILTLSWNQALSNSLPNIIGINGFFMCLFILSGFLFRYIVRHSVPPKSAT